MKCLTALSKSAPMMTIDGLAPLVLQYDPLKAVTISKNKNKLITVNTKTANPPIRLKIPRTALSFLFSPLINRAQAANTPDTAIIA